MSDSAAPFDRRALRRNRDRAARLATEASEFLFREVGLRLLDRLDDITRRFPVAVELGARDGALRDGLERRNGIRLLAQTDLSERFVRRCRGPRLVADEETPPLAPASVDLAVSNLALHRVNDLPGCLIQIRRSLKPDGLLLAALPGGDTLAELREALAEAEIAATGGLSPRLAPTIDVRDAGALLQRAGYALPVVDRDRIEVSYRDPLALLRDLRAMGEANALDARPRTVARRDVLAGAMARYAARHGDAQGRVAATFDILFLTAWSPQ